MVIYIYTFIIILILLIGLGMKWEIKLKTVVAWCAIVWFLASISLYFLNRIFSDLSVLTSVFIVLFQAGITTLVVILILFFRDPERTPPEKNAVILSPADGTIVYIKEIRQGEFPFVIKRGKIIPMKEFTGEEVISDQGIQIGIAMNLLNVHVNRAPIGGRIVQIKKIPGGFYSLKNVSSLFENERVLTLIDGEGMKVGIVQVASRLVRRIISYQKVGEEVRIGQRIGMIRFGSQVDLLLPCVEYNKILVKPGDEVKAGVSIMCEFTSKPDR